MVRLSNLLFHQAGHFNSYKIPQAKNGEEFERSVLCTVEVKDGVIG